MSAERLYLIDATAFCYRAYYALKGLSTSFGQPTNAIYGFINILNKILKDKKPDYLAVCFDVSRDTFRQKKFQDYKINRPPMPDGLKSQIPLIKQIVKAYGLAIFEKDGFEADDIIATLARLARENSLSTTIVSSDKDILQLVDDQTQVFSPYKDQGATYDARKVRMRFGVGPERITDIIALMGDDVDNIPGVPGIGEKTATELIGSSGSLEKLLNNIDNIKQERLKKTIKDNIDRINLNRELAELDRFVGGIDFDLDKLRIKEPDSLELFRLFKYLEFKRLLKGLLPEEEGPENTKFIEADNGSLENLISERDELFLCLDNGDNLIFYINPVRNIKQINGNKIVSNGVKGNFYRAGNLTQKLRAILEDPKVKKTGHDLKKIKISLAKNNVVLGGLYFDSMIAAYLVNPAKPQYDLAELAWDYLEESLGNNLTCEKEISLILKLKPKLEEELKAKELTELFCGLEMPLVEVLAAMELNGIKLDLKVIEGLSQQIEKRLIELIQAIYELSQVEFNINSPKQLREILFEKLKLPVIKRSKTGPSTDEEVLRALADKHKLPALLLEYRQLMKLKTTYIDTLPGLIDKNTGRIHASFNQTGTETGRLSSSNPNLQNIPVKTDIGKNIRRAIIASDKDSLLAAFDYSQIELRILAHLSGDENLIRAFKQGLDIHKATAGLIYGLSEGQVSDAMREVAKRVNFGIVYGLSSYGLSRDLGISVDDAQNFIDAYFLMYPKVKAYIEAQIQRAQERGFVTTLLGRRRYIPEINNKNQAIRQFAQRQAVNTPIQGSASDLIKLAMVQIHKEINNSGLEAKMILQIHDELVFDCLAKDLKELTELVRDRMENVLKLDVPIKVDIKFGANWLETEAIK